MNKLVSGTVAVFAFVLGSLLPAAALPVPNAAQNVTATSVILAKDKGLEEWWLRKKDRDSQIQHRDRRNGDFGGHDWKWKKKRHSHPRVHFYYDPWPYYGDDYYYHSHRSRVSHAKHVKWCKARYKSYNPRTDKFTGKNGKKYRCNSPYDGR